MANITRAVKRRQDDRDSLAVTEEYEGRLVIAGEKSPPKRP
jgi:hypothetical protein